MGSLELSHGSALNSRCLSTFGELDEDKDTEDIPLHHLEHDDDDWSAAFSLLQHQNNSSSLTYLRRVYNRIHDLHVYTRTRRRCSRNRFVTRSRTFQLLRLLVFILLAFILLSTTEGILYPSYQNPPKHYDVLQRTISESRGPGRGNPNNEKIFIATNIVNEELIRGRWGETLLELIDILGEDNVFLSIYENDSGIGTRDALRKLHQKLHCNSSVISGDHLSIEDLPKVILPNGERRTNRLAYLAEVRNRALRPLNRSYIPTSLDHMSGFSHVETKFDRVLFLNDIYFLPIDAAQLLFSTNVDGTGRARYRSVCAIDFTFHVLIYDTFVVRDTDGYGLGAPFFPWFVPMGSAQSRRAVQAGADAVPVRSCWGGMAAFSADLFQRFSAPGDISSSEPATQFRHDPEPFWEASECCLIFADFEHEYGPPNANDGTGVFINPFIRVAYTQPTWAWLKTLQRYERTFSNLQYIVSKLAFPEHNPRRLHSPGQWVEEKVWQNSGPASRVSGGGTFQTVERQAGVGGFCGLREMFVMKKNVTLANERGEKNWEEIPLSR